MKKKSHVKTTRKIQWEMLKKKKKKKRKVVREPWGEEKKGEKER